MKISFSTLACPEYSWNDIISTASDLAYDGIEIRGLGNDIDVWKSGPFTDKKISDTLGTLNRTGLKISCFSSNICLKYRNDNAIKEEISKYIDLAVKTGTPYIRILADNAPAPDGHTPDDDYIAEVISAFATPKVTLLVETNGVYSDTKKLKNLLDKIDSPYVAALWDLHHPYRYAGESPETTVENLGKYIKYCHIKDSVVQNGSLVYKLCGEGDLPLAECISELKKIGYDGYVSLEWVKRWTPTLENADIVFPHFAEFMSSFITERKSVTHKKAETVSEKKTKYDITLQKSITNEGTYPFPKNQLVDCTFPEMLDIICEQYPEQYAFRYCWDYENEKIDYIRTYTEFREDVRTFARSLIVMGVKPGDNVAIWATNVPAWYITFWAAVSIGAVLVTVNTAYKIHEAEYLLKQSDTHTLVMIDGVPGVSYVDIVRELLADREKLPELRNIITVDSKQEFGYSWDEAIKMSEQVDVSEVLERQEKIDKHDVCNMQYTSGTTGFPKGVMLTHYNVVNNGKAIGDCMDLSTAEQLMIHVPMFHCFGMVLAMTASVTHGTTMTPQPYFNAKKSLYTINKEKITAFHGVPTMFIAMLEHEDFATTDFSRIRTGIMAGSPCPAPVMEEVLNKMNMTDICITYGQTESSPADTMSKTTDSTDTRVNTVGSAIFGVECRIVDPETNEELPDNTDGEFVARGYNIMKGYYKMPEATANAIDKDGWLHTGDLARRLPDGNYKITGRIKDMIIRGGENIYPKEIEDFYYTHPKVKDVQVIGVPSKTYGEEVCAVIVLKDEATEEELLNFAKERIAKHKVPRYITFANEFPMNAAGKILKYKMREQAVIDLGLQSQIQ